MLVLPTAVNSNEFQSTPPHGRRRPPSKLQSVRRHVSIHASAREATSQSRMSASQTRCFNPRLRTGGDLPRLQCGALVILSFNPRLRTGGDNPAAPATTPDARFNPRLRTGGDAWAAVRSGCTATGFNPRLRTGGDVLPPPVRRLPRRFQSTPPHGRRLMLVLPTAVNSNEFQSTPPHGRRRPPSKLQSVRRHVSIHASAREATSQSRMSASQTRCFNPRLRTGGDLPRLQCGALVILSFNPRLRTGGDNPAAPATTPDARFNPRLRTGGDAWAAVRSGCTATGFNPRLRTGGDLSLVRGASARETFQSTPPHGRRPEPHDKMHRARGVSIHASAREATPSEPPAS